VNQPEPGLTNFLPHGLGSLSWAATDKQASSIAANSAAVEDEADDRKTTPVCLADQSVDGQDQLTRGVWSAASDGGVRFRGGQ